MESPLMTPANESQQQGALEKALEEDPAELPEADPEAAKVRSRAFFNKGRCLKTIQTVSAICF